MGSNAHLAVGEIFRELFATAHVWGNVRDEFTGMNCTWGFSLGDFHDGILFTGESGECFGACLYPRVTSLHVSRLRFESPWLTHIHTHASVASIVVVSPGAVIAWCHPIFFILIVTTATLSAF